MTTSSENTSSENTSSDNTSSDNTGNNTSDDSTGRDAVASRWASVAALAGVAGEVEALRTRLVDVFELPGVVSELGGMVAELADEVTAHTSRRPERAGSPSWLDLPATEIGPRQDAANTAARKATEAAREIDADAPEVAPQVIDPAEVAGELLTELAGWVGRVYLRYPDAAADFPECWLWHPTVVEELVWLHRAWTQAYVGEGASVSGAADWHDRYRPGVVRRLGTYTGSCSLEAHTGTQPGAAGVTAPVTDAVARIAGWWSSTDPSAGAPVPSDADVVAAAGYWRSTSGGGRH